MKDDCNISIFFLDSTVKTFIIPNIEFIIFNFNLFLVNHINWITELYEISDFNIIFHFQFNILYIISINKDLVWKWKVQNKLIL